MFIDAHTHSPGSADISVVSTFAHQPMPKVGINDKLSCGIHPWHVYSTHIERDLHQIENYCKQNLIHAIGECGLDRSTPDIESQLAVFKRQILLSEQYQLPLIIHSVKTHHSILQLKKEIAPKQPWMIHGFTGKIEIAQQLIHQNIFISLGQHIFLHPEKRNDLLTRVNKDFILLETDESDVEIVLLYKHLAEVWLLGLDEVKEIIRLNFNRVFRSNGLVRAH